MTTESSGQAAMMTELHALITNGRQSGKASELGITKSPTIAAMISKLNEPLEKKALDPSVEGGGLNQIYPSVGQITRQVMSRVENAENTFKLFPDIELAAQIIISSIVSPKDMLKSELNFKLDAGEWPVEVVSKITDLIRDEITQTYGIEDELYDILRDALFRAGSHPKLILPEAAVDHVINMDQVSAMESISQTDLFVQNTVDKIKPLGILGNPHVSNAKVVSALESIFTPAGSGITNYDQSLYVDRSKLDWIDSEIFVAEKIADLAANNISVIDNVHFLKVPELIKKGQQARVTKAISGDRAVVPSTIFATESRKGENFKEIQKKISGGQLKDVLYKGPKSGYKPFISVPGKMSLRRRSVGRPLVMSVSAESVIPVYAPGDYKNHIGYFIAVDVDGNPITLDSTVAEFGQGMSSINQSDRAGGNVSNYLTERATRNIVGDDFTPIINDMATIYAEVIEKDLMQRMANGLYHQEVEIGRDLEIYRVMLTRSLQSRATRLLYVPGEYVTYFAFKYHRNGVGRSYLDDLSNIIGMRAMALFSSLWAKVRSSISTVKTTINFDPKDPDPIKTIEMVKHLIARSRQQYFPNGLRSVSDFTGWIQSAGIELSWEGHPHLPKTTLETESKNIDHVKPDDTLDETLRHMTYMHFGLSPETVDAAARTDFATTVQQQGVLFSKRILMLGKTFGVDMTDYVRKLVSNDEIIQQKIVDILIAHKADIDRMLDEQGVERGNTEDQAERVRLTRRLLADIIGRITVGVPEPDTTSLINMKTEIENYEAIIDKAIEYVISEEMLPSDLVGDDANQHISSMKSIWKAYLMRQFLSDNNIVPEVFDIVAKNNDGKVSTVVNEEITDYTKTAVSLIVDIIARMSKARDAVTNDLNTLGSEPGEPVDSGGGDYGSDNSDSEAGGDDFGMGGSGDDLGGLDELPPTDEVPTEETPPGDNLSQ